MVRLAILATTLIIIIITGLVVLLRDDDGGGGSFDAATYPYPVQQPEEIEDRSHLDVGETYDSYTSNPPTSGPHTLRPAETGISDVAIPKEVLVHNMEHSQVIVWYNCNAEPSLSNDECATLRDDLSQVVQQQLSDGLEVVMTPYPAMDDRIALTAWGYLDAFGEFDIERVRTFIQTFYCETDLEGFC